MLVMPMVISVVKWTGTAWESLGTGVKCYCYIQLHLLMMQ